MTARIRYRRFDPRVVEIALLLVGKLGADVVPLLREIELHWPRLSVSVLAEALAMQPRGRA